MNKLNLKIQKLEYENLLQHKDLQLREYELKIKELEHIIEINNLKNINNNEKNNKIIKKKEIEILNDVGIIFIKNPMLNYIDENTYKIACCLNYETTLKQDLNYFIETCKEYEYISVSTILDDKKIMPKEQISIAKKIIMKVLKNELICNYLHRYLETVIIKNEEFKNKIEEIKNKLKNYIEEINDYENNKNEYEMINIENLKYKMIQYDGIELFNTINEKNFEDLKKTFKKKDGKMMAYFVKNFKYYGDEICCIDISIKDKIPKSTYILVSEYELELTNINYNNFVETIHLSLEKLITYVMIYFYGKLFYKTKNNKNIFLKISLSDVQECFNKIEKDKELFNLTTIEFKKEINKKYIKK